MRNEIAVGDYVRCESGRTKGGWATGVVTEIDQDGDPTVHADLHSDGWPILWSDGRFCIDLSAGGTCRRIPRPVNEVKAETSGVLLRCQGLNSGRQCDETVRGHVGGWRCPTHDACTTYHGGGDWCMFCGRGPSIHRVDPAAAPSQVTVTYDGLTAEQCLERYVQRQRHDTSEPSISYTHLKPAQLAAARELWSLQLRQRVAETDAADRERDRLQVVIDDGEVGPW